MQTKEEKIKRILMAAQWGAACFEFMLGFVKMAGVSEEELTKQRKGLNLINNIVSECKTENPNLSVLESLFQQLNINTGQNLFPTNFAGVNDEIK